MNSLNNKDIQTPPCKHFDDCGGCSMQRHSEDKYYAIKQNLISETAERLNSFAEVLPIVKVGKYSRRRADFKVSVNKGDINIGFFKHQSHEVVNIQECLIIEKEIFQLLEPLKKLLSTLKKPSKVYSISVTKILNGFDIILKSTKKIVFDEIAFQNFIQDNSIKSLYLDIKNIEGQIKLHDEDSSKFLFKNNEVSIPPNSFLQASEAGQEAIIDFIFDNVNVAKNIADIYSGCGTYTIPLISERGAFVTSYEGSTDMISALVNNLRNLNLSHLNTSQVKDLTKTPIKPDALNNFDLVIINPPRVGATRQISEISKSTIKRLIYISCDRRTFEADSKVLINSGYNLKKIQGIDQFYWSKHIEIASLFVKV